MSQGKFNCNHVLIRVLKRCSKVVMHLRSPSNWGVKVIQLAANSVLAVEPRKKTPVWVCETKLTIQPERGGKGVELCNGRLSFGILGTQLKSLKTMGLILQKAKCHRLLKRATRSN